MRFLLGLAIVWIYVSVVLEISDSAVRPFLDWRDRRRSASPEREDLTKPWTRRDYVNAALGFGILTALAVLVGILGWFVGA